MNLTFCTSFCIEIVALFLLLAISTYLRLPMVAFPVVINTDCTLHIVTETIEGNKTLEIGTESFWYNFSTIGSAIIIFDTFRLPDPFEAQQNIRYTTRHSSAWCVVFLLETTSINGTVTAIEHSGLQNSDFAVFIKLQSTTDEVNAVSRLLNTAFITFSIKPETILVYCFGGSRKLQSLQFLIKTNYVYCGTAWQQVTGILELQMLEQILSKTALETTGCISHNRQLFYESIPVCQSGYMVGLMISANVLNVSLTSSPAIFEDDEEDHHSILQIFWLHYTNTRSLELDMSLSYKITFLAQYNVDIIYCSNVFAEISEKWETHFSFIDYRIWTLLLGIFLVITIIYRNPLNSLDLLWFLVGQSISEKRHMRSILIPVMIGSMFLMSIYSAGFSLENLSIRTISSLQDLTSLGYKFYMRPSTKRAFKYGTSPALKAGLDKAFGVDFLDLIVSEGYSDILNYSNLSQALDRFANKRTLGIGNKGKPLFTSSPFISSILTIASRVVIEDRYLCGSIPLPKSVYSHFRFGYITWGRYATKFRQVFNGLNEMGLIDWIQSRIASTTYIGDKTPWAPLRVSIGVPAPIRLQSPLGVAIAAQVSVCVGIFVLWICFNFLLSTKTGKSTIRKIECLRFLFWWSLETFLHKVLKHVVRKRAF